MRKEQTPITADEWLYDNDKFEDNYQSGQYEWIDAKELYEAMEQYAQYREKKAVLEALERDKKFYCDNVTISRLRNTKTNAEWRRLVMNRFFAKQK